VILWARDVVGSSGVTDAGALLKPPDGSSSDPSAGFVTLKRFEGGFYHGLLSLLDGRYGSPPVTAGRAVSAADLARTDVIAFELNGGSPAGSGGWESCKWVFDDGGGAPVTVLWDERVGAPQPGEVVANGSTDGDRYSGFFGISPPTTARPAPSTVISYILFSLPTLDVTSPSFTVTLAGYLTAAGAPNTPQYSEGTPDPDAVGVLACVPEEEVPK